MIPLLWSVDRYVYAGNGRIALKKQIAFYLMWDILLLGVFYLSGVLTSWLTFGSASAYYQLDLIVQLISWAMIGGLFAWLIYFGSGLILTVRVALTELILIGIPSLYLAAMTSVSYLWVSMSGGSLLLPVPSWLLVSMLPAEVGGVLLGYALVIFIVRIKKCKSRGKHTVDYVVE